MKERQSRALLTAIWFATFVLNLGILFELNLTGYLESDQFRAGLMELSKLYAPYLVALGTFYWHATKNADERPGKPGTAGTALAVGSSVVWNGAIFFSLLPAALHRDKQFGPALETMSLFESTFSWLVAGALGYYFAAPRQHE